MIINTQPNIKKIVQEIIDDSKTSFSGIGFEMGKYISEIKMKKTFSILAQLQNNIFKGRSKLQLNIKDISFEQKS